MTHTIMGKQFNLAVRSRLPKGIALWLLSVGGYLAILLLLRALWSSVALGAGGFFP
jgi:hypothetical protein